MYVTNNYCTFCQGRAAILVTLTLHKSTATTDMVKMTSRKQEFLQHKIFQRYYKQAKKIVKNKFVTLARGS